jgi:predicted secreted Zn-dependent protease
MTLLKLLLVLVPAGALCAADSLVVRTNYYSVSGDNLRAIREDMARQHPWKEEQDGFTRWKVNWSFTSRDSGSGCSIQSIQTTTDITITLPRWNGSSQVDESVKAGWSVYISALAAHEDGHKRIALAAAGEVRKRILRNRTAADCTELEMIVNREAKKVIDQFVEREKAYDERTEHGRKQPAAVQKAR